jgi:ubiquinone/menaquinone biosynthesis C-methylase UbiE
MMSDCCSSFCSGTQQQFTAVVAERDLKRYRRKGPIPTTRLLRDGILAAGGGQSLLDIGAGIGALSLELLAHGFGRATLVEASPAYLVVARRAAAERGLEGSVEFCGGDFVDHASQLAPADVVVLDRVVCCYPAHQPLLEAALAHSYRLFAYSHPHDRWDVRLVVRVQNRVRGWTRRAFRTFVHSEAAMGALLSAHGFRRISRRKTFVWCADVYLRDAT